MSSIRLLKERNGVKPGTVISVPFGVGLELIAAGIGERPDAAAVNPVVAELQVAPAVAVAAPAPPAPPITTEFPKEKETKKSEGGHKAKP